MKGQQYKYILPISKLKLNCVIWRGVRSAPAPVVMSHHMPVAGHQTTLYHHHAVGLSLFSKHTCVCEEYSCMAALTSQFPTPSKHLTVFIISTAFLCKMSCTTFIHHTFAKLCFILHLDQLPQLCQNERVNVETREDWRKLLCGSALHRNGLDLLKI